MNEDELVQYITATFEGIDTITQAGNYFFLYDPSHKFPLATLMTNDDNDQASNLNRPGVFRLNIGVSKQTFRTLFGSTISRSGAGVSEYDFTALDQLMPHPVYGRMYWVCILNPSVETFQAAVRPLLAEAYEMALSKYAKPAPSQ